MTTCKTCVYFEYADNGYLAYTRCSRHAVQVETDECCEDYHPRDTTKEGDQ